MDTNIISKAQESKAPAKAAKKDNSLRGLVERMQSAGEIAKALPAVMTPERFCRIVQSALSNNKSLQQCTSQSFLGAMMTAAQLGLEVNSPLGAAYLIPYRNKGVLECQFQLGYKGLIDLAYRSGEVKSIQAHVVYENDVFNYQLGLEPKLEHIPAKENRGNPAWFYAVFHTKAGGYGFEVMSVDDIKKHAEKFSKAYATASSPWKTNFEAMALKTVLKRALKYAPISTEFSRAVSSDETIKTSYSDDMLAEPDVLVVDSETGEIVDQEAGTNGQ